MPRVIRYFDKANESYIAEVKLPEVPLKALQQLFCVSADNPIYDSFPIGNTEETFFKKYAEINFDFDRFEYFLEYDS